MFTVGIGYRNVIKGGTGTDFKEREQAMGTFPLKATRLGLARVSIGVFPLQLGVSEEEGTQQGVPKVHAVCNVLGLTSKFLRIHKEF